MADDAAFARFVENNPADALRGVNLSRSDIARIEEAVAEIRDNNGVIRTDR